MEERRCGARDLGFGERRDAAEDGEGQGLKDASAQRPLWELAGLFLRLGSTAFGGPVAHIALMEEEVVRRRHWFTHDEFMDLLGATHLIPGPNSTEMAIHIGHRRAGWPGLLVAGACFILPAACLVSVMAWGYVRFGQLPRVEGILYGVKPVIIAIVGQALLGLGRTALKSGPLVVLAAVAAALSWWGVNELGILFGGGLLALALRRSAANPPPAGVALMGMSPGLPVVASAGAAGVVTTFGLWPMFLVFLKVGAVLFGSGYVLLAFLRADLVERLGWLTENQLLDAVAVGQITPGPVFTTATFIGFLLGGLPGAGVATLGIFLPAFIFVAVSGPLVSRLRRSAAAGAFLDGVNAVSLALMAVVTGQLAGVAVRDWLSLGLAVVSLGLLVIGRIKSTWLVLGGAAAGWLAGAMGWTAAT